MTASGIAALQGQGWTWPIDLERYDRSPRLRAREREAIEMLGRRLRRRRSSDRDAVEWAALGRLVVPLDDARAALVWCPEEKHHVRSFNDAIGLILGHCADADRSFWGWTAEGWAALIGATAGEFDRITPAGITRSARAYLITFAYLIGEFDEFERIGEFQRTTLARRVFGDDMVRAAESTLCAALDGWGYEVDRGTRRVIAQLLLVNRSPCVENLDDAAFARMYEDPDLSLMARRCLPRLHRSAAALGHATPPPRVRTKVQRPAVTGAPDAWVAVVERWRATTTYSPKAVSGYCVALAKAGRWLTAEMPAVTEPGQWTRETCAAWIGAVDRMMIGDFIQRRDGVTKRIGEPIAPRTKAGHLVATRVFFRELQEWEWIPRRFDPNRALAIPKSVKSLIGPDPRVIADDVWAKLLWAGLNLEPDDLPAGAIGRRGYPIEFVQALTMTWLFSGLRSNEVARLRVGCIRWQPPSEQTETADGEERDRVCMLDVPTHKTGTSFTKPVDVLLGEAINAWERVRPAQPSMIDAKTAEQIDFLFAFRARPLGTAYINDTIIPMLCTKAGVPLADARGRITSHRARSTIASQLYNAKEPMTLFELQEWLGHRSPHSTQHYAKITPVTLTRAYRDAGYFARNVRTIEVLIDRDAITTGTAGSGGPWVHYDLGHGYCSYTFFEQCPHRMACARCDFYIPKPSSQAGLLEANVNLARMLTAIPLTDDERAAVEDGQTAVEQLLGRLDSLPTPDGRAPAAPSRSITTLNLHAE